MLFQLGWPLDNCFTHPPPSETGFILLAKAPTLWDGCGLFSCIFLQFTFLILEFV
jgi:hypothetical protein